MLFPACKCRNESAPIHKVLCVTWEGLQADVVHDLVVAALKEGAVDGCKGDHALAGQPCRKGDRVLHAQAQSNSR